MKNNQKIALFFALICSTSAVQAQDFSGKKFSFSTPVTPGALLECLEITANTMKRDDPKMFAWASAQGLVSLSAVSATPSYTNKASSLDTAGQPTLFLGCWIAQEIIKEQVNGTEQAFARGQFKFNEALRLSPASTWSICRKKRPGAAIYVQGDVQIIYPEQSAKQCSASEWQEPLNGADQLTKMSTLFALRLSGDKKNYIRNVGF
jgi:hypothetical protein